MLCLVGLFLVKVGVFVGFVLAICLLRLSLLGFGCCGDLLLLMVRRCLIC